MKVTHALTALFTLLAIACGTTEPPASEATSGDETNVTVVPPGSEPPAGPAAAAPAPAPLTTDQLVAKLDACNQMWFGGKWDQMKAECLTANVTSETVGSGMPPSSGPDAVVAEGQMWHAAISEIALSQEVVLVSGTDVVAVSRYTGKQTGPLMGVPASGKAVGLYGAEVTELTPDGKSSAMRGYFDIPTIMGQIGAHKNPHRAAIPASATPRVLAIGSDSEAETKNLAAVRAAIQAWNAGDLKTLKAAFGKGWLHRDVQMPADQKGPQGDAALKGYKTAFPDGKLEEIKAVAAGDYVAIEQRFTGTNTGRNSAMGLKKATGKPIATRFLQLFKVQDGKIVEGWEIGNGMEMATQLGLVPPPAAAPAAAPAK
jgi:predicted ester cyclase